MDDQPLDQRIDAAGGHRVEVTVQDRSARFHPALGDATQGGVVHGGQVQLETDRRIAVGIGARTRLAMASISSSRLRTSSNCCSYSVAIRAAWRVNAWISRSSRLAKWYVNDPSGTSAAAAINRWVVPRTP